MSMDLSKLLLPRVCVLIEISFCYWRIFLQVAHERAVFKASALAVDTKNLTSVMTKESLQELRATQKPIIEVEDLMAAIIMILKSPTADLTWQKGAKRQMANLDRCVLGGR